MEPVKKVLGGLIISLCAAFCIFLVTCVQVVITNGPSMKPTFVPGDTLISIRDFRQPRPGDVVLIRHGGSLVVKRVIAVAGQQAVTQTIPEAETEVRSELVITSTDYKEGIDEEAGTYTFYGRRELPWWETGNGPDSVPISKETYWTVYYYWDDNINATVPENFVFVAGDNPSESYDSRNKEFGLVAIKDIQGYIVWKNHGGYEE